MNSLTLVQRIAIYALPLLLALTVREMMRARVAFMLGDTSALQSGMLSWNPLKYVDPIGTVVLPMLTVALSSSGLGGFLLGWPKLVPIDLRRLGNPRRDLALIAATGLLADLVMAIGWAVVLKVAAGFNPQEGVWLGVAFMGFAGITLNVGFLVLNLLPIPPFDVGRMLLAVAPPKMAMSLARIEPYSVIILLLLMVTGILARLITPPWLLLSSLVMSVVGVNPGAAF